jgi:chromosome segregation ATPase
MTDPDHDGSQRGERAHIQAAIDRLLRDQPLHSTGQLTVVQLAAEAGVKRWRLTRQHTDLMRAFQAAALQQRHESPLVTPWRERVHQLEADRADLRSENADLRATVETYAEAIDDLNRAVDQLASSQPLAATLRRIR